MVCNGLARDILARLLYGARVSLAVATTVRRLQRCPWAR